MTTLPGTECERYVALGDSYTIGEGAAPEESWPAVLTRHLNREGVRIGLVANPSVTGWTSAQLIEHELPVLETANATFVTVLIGVNDWVQDVPKDEFQRNLIEILDRVQAALPQQDKVLMLTIPDFSGTPDGPTYARGRDISAGIAGFNKVIAELAGHRGLPLVDLFPLSRELIEPEFIAADGLHPSAAAYARWEEIIFPAVFTMLESGRLV